MWRPGRKLIHPFNQELGVGVVISVDGRFLRVWFPRAESELTLSAQGAGLTPLVLQPGSRARLIESEEEVEIAALDGDAYRLLDGRRVEDGELWPVEAASSPLERLAAGDVDRARAFANRVDGLTLLALRESSDLGRFLGGRIELFPHQLFTASRAVEGEPVRWLLADEVGLGKTIEACMILSALVRTGRAERSLIVAPDTLTVQWLGELYRKFHQVFVMVDEELVEGLTRIVGPDANVFDVQPAAVIAVEDLLETPGLLDAALAAPPDLLVVDEAHRLARGSEDGRLDELVRRARHALLLTATPLAADRRGFHHLLSLLHPDAFDDFEAFEAALAREDMRIPCASAVRRSDIGGLPPRVPVPVDLPATSGGPVEDDPRAHWLVDSLREWSERGEKTLVFVHDIATLEALQAFLESRLRTRMAVFHEGLSAPKRDIEVASFRDTRLPALLCSEAGGEGRNFQFCKRLVHYDLPLSPLSLEQRIGRLDRIGREGPVESVYFRGGGEGLDLARVYEALELFERPSADVDGALARAGEVIAAAASGASLDLPKLAAEVREARAEAGRDLSRVTYADAYSPEQAASVEAQLPPDLDERTARFCLGALKAMGFDVVDKAGTALYYVEFGAAATVDALPGLRDGERWLGSFDRREALERDELEFFAGGHSLIEALLLEVEDGPRGRAARIELQDAVGCGEGLLIVARHGPELLYRVVDRDGRERPEWLDALLAALPKAKDLPAEEDPRFPDRVQLLGRRVEIPGRIDAVAWFRGPEA